MTKNGGAEKSLQQPARTHATGKLTLPLLPILRFHFFPAYLFLQKRLKDFGSYLAAVQGHAHTVTAERRNHARRIAQHEQPIFHRRFFAEADL